ncbi:unnamed protein product [Heligmosomoides polygyrus]|uniref:Uncharacterized protein n=1 Tax=Heligmosomoides polygyrus TaxID=6339 RepID=A0A183GLJ0_HELPZ|nr:unnamed protein product [Heligmosomoides polygyrus]
MRTATSLTADTSVDCQITLPKAVLWTTNGIKSSPDNGAHSSTGHNRLPTTCGPASRPAFGLPVPGRYGGHSLSPSGTHPSKALPPTRNGIRPVLYQVVARNYGQGVILDANDFFIAGPDHRELQYVPMVQDSVYKTSSTL